MEIGVFVGISGKIIRTLIKVNSGNILINVTQLLALPLRCVAATKLQAIIYYYQYSISMSRMLI